MTVTPLTTGEADQALAPLARFKRVALAVSGGPDSLALLSLAQDFARRQGLASPVVLTVDHDLREGSRREAKTVSHIAHSLGLHHETLTWRHAGLGSAIQAKARMARYDLMSAYCTAHDIPALVTAHHLDDQAETFLMRLKRGSGLDGLAAIPEEGHWGGVRLLRPLLEVTKAQLIATAETAGLPFVSDPSNADARFERVRLRGAMAALAEMGLEPQAIALSAKRLRRARAALEAETDEFVAKHGEVSPLGHASISRDALLGAPDEIGLRALGRLLSLIGGLQEPVQLAKLETLFEGLRADPGKVQNKVKSKAQTLGRCQVVSSGTQILLFREVRKDGLVRAMLSPREPLLWDNRFRLKLGPKETRPVAVEMLGESGVEALLRDQGLSLEIPRQAAFSLPVCRDEKGGLILPDFGQGKEPFSGSTLPQEARLRCEATFLGGLF